MKSRKLNLSVQLNDEIKTRLKRDIGVLMGVESVVFENDTIVVVYDLLQVSLDNIESVVVKSAVGLDGAVTKKIMRSFIRYSEECELENLSHLS